MVAIDGAAAMLCASAHLDAAEHAAEHAFAVELEGVDLMDVLGTRAATTAQAAEGTLAW